MEEKIKIITAIEKLPGKTIKLTITIPWSQIKKVYQRILKKTAQKIQLPGFRKGKTPLSVVENKVGQEALFSEVLQEILPQVYTQAVNKHKIRPIITPKIKVVKMEKNKDWQIQAATCEKPEIDLNNYQEEVKKILKTVKIWLPGEEKKKEKETKAQKLEKLFNALLKTVKINLPSLLVEEEVNRLLAKLLEEINKMGLSLDSYLNSLKKTAEQLRKEYQNQAEKNLKLGFILDAIADDLKIQVDEKEIEEMIKKEQKLANQKYLLASILRRQKTIDKLLNL